MMKDLEANSVTEIKSANLAANQVTSFVPPLISKEYVVWAELGLSNPNTAFRPVQLQAYNRKAGTIKSLAQYEVSSTLMPVYALYGGHVAWQDGAIHIMDLDTGETDSLNTTDVFTLALDDRYIVWPARPEINGFDIYGATLGDRKPTPLVVNPGNQSDLAIVGDWLIWENNGGPDDRSISSMPIADLFKKEISP